MADFVTDTFTGTGGTLLSAHNADVPGTPWTAITGSPDVVTLNGSGGIVGTVNAGAASQYYAPGSPLSADYQATGTIVKGAASTGVSIRALGRVNIAQSAEFYAAGYNVPAAGWELYVYKAGIGGGAGFILLGTFAQVLTNGVPYTVTWRGVGNDHYLLVDGVVRISVSDANVTAAGRAGLQWYSAAGTDMVMTDFVAGEIPADPLTPGVTTRDYFRPSGVKFTATAATGGVGAKTYLWHRDTNRHFTPSGSNDLPGETGLELLDETLDEGVLYWYVLAATDGVDTVYTDPVSGSLADYEPLCLLIIGTSLDIYDPPSGETVGELLGKYLQGMNGGTRMVSVVNRAIGGSSTSDWLAGSANLTNAINAMDAEVATMPPGTEKWCVWDHGYNDAALGRSAVDFISNCLGSFAIIIADGCGIIFDSPPFDNFDGLVPPERTPTELDAINALALSYYPFIAAEVNGSTILAGSTGLFRRIGNDPDLLFTEDNGVHPNALGTVALAIDKAYSIGNALSPTVCQIYGSGLLPA